MTKEYSYTTPSGIEYDYIYTLELEISCENLEELQNLYSKIKEWTNHTGKHNFDEYKGSWFGNIVQGAELGTITMGEIPETETCYYCDGFIDDSVLDKNPNILYIVATCYDAVPVRIWEDLVKKYLPDGYLQYEIRGEGTKEISTNKEQITYFVNKEKNKKESLDGEEITIEVDDW